MTSKKTPARRFGELRSILQRQPGSMTWSYLLEVCAIWAREDHEAFARMGLSYALEHLERWPDRERAVPAEVLERWLASGVPSGERWLLEMARAVCTPGLSHRDEARGLVRELARAPWASSLTVLEMPRCYMRNLPVWMLARAPLLELHELDLSFNGLSVWGMHALQRADSLTSLRRLSLAGNGLDAKAIAPLLAATKWTGLRSLDLSNNAITDDGLLDITRAPSCQTLEQLSLARADLTDAGMAHLARTPMLGALRGLDLGRNEIGEHGCEVLQGATNLRALVLTGNPLTDPGAKRLFSLESMPMLRELELASVQLGASSMRALASCDTALSLRSLDLSDNKLGLEGASALADARGLEQLEHLKLPGCGLDADAVEQLARAPFVPNLRSLALSFNPVGDAGAALMLRIAPLKRLQKLSLHHCAIYGSVSLPRELGWVVRHLDLQSNPFGDAFIEELVQRSWMQSVRRLDLRRVRLTDRGAWALARSPHLRQLEWLDLGENEISGEGAHALIAEGLPGLRRLGLSGTRVDDAAARRLARTPGAQRLRILELAWSNLSAHGAAALAHSPLLEWCDVRVERSLDAPGSALRQTPP